MAGAIVKAGRSACREEATEGSDGGGESARDGEPDRGDEIKMQQNATAIAMRVECPSLAVVFNEEGFILITVRSVAQLVNVVISSPA